ncbi:MAG TPA: hypothetical protein VN887_07550 [Candidatus Angelobacter sp.]|nr:hypothetical protein [Candidatus Angelobacter sp.]
MSIAWWKKDLGRLTSLSPTNFEAAKDTLLLQALLTSLSGLILDGGETLRVVVLAALMWWIAFLRILVNRPTTTKKSDVLFLKLGFLLLLPLSFFTQPIWGWLR